MKNLNNAEWKRKQNTNAVIFDVRTDEEVAEGILENAINDIQTTRIYGSFRKNG
jgi:rhodanese-related sulfurtransferase